MRRFGLGVTLALALFPATASGADVVWGSRSERLVEHSHEIDVTMGYVDAELRVRRTVRNGGERHDQAIFMIDAPVEAVATGLRTRGVLAGKPHWFDGVLMEAESAAEKYRELTGIGGYYPKDPALLSWRHPGHLALQVFPVAPGQDKMIEYTLRLPVEYDDGLYRLRLDALGTGERPAMVVLRPADRRDQLFLDGDPIGAGRMVRADQQYEITMARVDAPVFDARLASIETGTRSVVHYQLAIAQRVAEIPRKAAIVVVLDMSRSRDRAEVEAQIGATLAYLGHFEGRNRDARVEVVTFDRQARRRHGSMVSARVAMADLQSLDPDVRGNGSEVEVAVATAAEILRRQPADRARRMVVLTDGLTRQGLTPQRLAAITGRSGAIVHLGFVDEGAPALTRDDDHPWAAAARTTGGLAWEASASAPTRGDDRWQSDVFLEWARPVRVDRLQVMADGTVADDLGLPDSVAEGFGVSLLDLYDDGVDRVAISGELWSQPIRDVSVADRAHGDRWSALVFGSSLLDDLSEPEMMVLATRGGAVSPVTSYLAIEPGVRPSTEGLDEIELWGAGGGGTGSGAIGLGSVSTIGHGGSPVDPQAFLDGKVEGAARTCGIPTGQTVQVTLQTTLAEVAAVDSVIGHGTDTVAAACVEDELWKVELPSVFAFNWRRWTASG